MDAGNERIPLYQARARPPVSNHFKLTVEKFDSRPVPPRATGSIIRASIAFVFPLCVCDRCSRQTWGHSTFLKLAFTFVDLCAAILIV